jgi:nucleotide-binding universal stress UspA family protein
MTTNEIVVGVDGSDTSLTAVRWAATEAQRRNAALRIVLAFEWAWPGAKFAATPPIEYKARERADEVLDAALAEARAAAPDLTVTGAAVRGRPAETLIDAGRTADLLVVGNRGHGGFVNLLLGSIGQQVATHASGNVAVVRQRPDATDGPVVVGVDGSPSTEHTLQVAFEAAAARGTSLIAVRAFEAPVIWGGYGVTPHAYDTTHVEAEERKALAEAVAPWREKYPTVPVEILVATGYAADVLVGVSKTAQLVVVGTRGHGGFAGLLLGSVGQQLLHHAHSTVLIVRPVS